MIPEKQNRIVELFRTCQYSDHEIAQIVGCGSSTVHVVVRQMLPSAERRELMQRRAWLRRKYHHDPDLFALPLSDEELWLFGLLMADGSTDAYRVHINLAAYDCDALETARRVARSDAPTYPIEPPARNPWNSGAGVGWRIDSREIVSRVTALGMVRAKSRRRDVHVPAHVAESPHFWRGLIDGDGTVSHRRSGRPVLQVLGGECCWSSGPRSLWLTSEACHPGSCRGRGRSFYTSHA